jgi:hypothetical protein
MARERSGAHGFVRAAAALALMFGLGACEGENLFKNTDPVTEGPPRITQLLVPEQAFAAEDIPVRVSAVARRGLTEIVVRYRGALNTDQNFGFALGTDSATVDTDVIVLQPLDSLLYIEALARDLAGRTSPSVFDTVRITQAQLGVRN